MLRAPIACFSAVGGGPVRNLWTDQISFNTIQVLWEPPSVPSPRGNQFTIASLGVNATLSSSVTSYTIHNPNQSYVGSHIIRIWAISNHYPSIIASHNITIRGKAPTGMQKGNWLECLSEHISILLHTFGNYCTIIITDSIPEFVVIGGDQ